MSVNSLFQKVADRFFLKFCMLSILPFKLDGLKCQKLTKPNFSEIFIFWGKIQKLKFLQNRSFWLLPKIYLHWYVFFPLNMLLLTVFPMILQKLNVWEKSSSSVMAWNALNQSDCGVLWLSKSLEGINWTLSFLAWR